MPKAPVSAYQIPDWRLNEGVRIYRDKTSACIHMLISGAVANYPLKNRIILYLEKKHTSRIELIHFVPFYRENQN